MGTLGSAAADTDREVKEQDNEEKKQELLKSLQEKVDEVDSHVTDLANSFDYLLNVLCGRSGELKNDIVQQDPGNSDEDNHLYLKTQGNMSHLIELVKRVDKSKVQAIKSVSRLIHFIHADREEISTNQSLESCKALEIDKYLNKYPSSNEYGDILIEMLQEQNKRLQQKYKLSRDHLKIVSEREKLVTDDRNCLREQLVKLKSMKEDLQKIEVKLKEKERLLESVVCRDFYEVTIASNIRTYRPTDRPHKLEFDLIRKLNNEMDSQRLGIHIKKPVFTLDFINIMTCYHEPPDRSWESILQECASMATITSKMLLIVFYEDSDKSKLEQAILRKCAFKDKDRVIPWEYADNKLKSNTTALQDIVQFVVENGHRQCEVVSCVSCSKH